MEDESCHIYPAIFPGFYGNEYCRPTRHQKVSDIIHEACVVFYVVGFGSAREPD